MKKLIPKSSLLQVLIIASIIIPVTFQNCAKKTGNRTARSLSSLDVTDERLLRYMDDAQLIINELSMIVGDSEVARIVADLQTALDNLKRLIYDERRSNYDPVLLSEVDHLVMAISNAKDYSLGKRIDEMEIRIAALEAELGEFLNFFFGGSVCSSPTELAQNGPVTHCDVRQAIADFRTRFDSVNALSEFNFASYLMMSVGDLQERAKDMLVDIQENQAALQAIRDSEENLANLQGKVCRPTDPPVERCVGEDAINLANSSSNSIVTTAPDAEANSCSCVPLEELDCNLMFPGNADVDTSLATSRSQCNIFLGVLKLHDQQLREIARIDKMQNDMLETLNGQLTDLTELVRDIGAKVDYLMNEVAILKLKAQRQEVAAVINERVDHILGWATRRTGDVSHRFCHVRVREALNLFDYEVARHNWQFCHERLDVIRKAKEKAMIARAFVNGALSANVDTPCNATISHNGQNIRVAIVPEAHKELLFDSDFYAKVYNACSVKNQNGDIVAASGATMVIGGLIQANALLDSIAPEFRTVDYMRGKAEMAQRLAYRGKTTGELSGAEIDRYQDINPASTRTSGGSDVRIRDTNYAKIERLFVNRYIDTVYRIGANRTFPVDASQIQIPSVMHQAWTYDQMTNSSSLSAIKAIEIGENGWRITGRNVNFTTSGNPLVDRNGKSMYQFPRDASEHCPVENQDVVLRNNNDGHYYVYRVFYNGFWEVVRPRTSGGVQVRIANSGANLSVGMFNKTGGQVSHGPRNTQNDRLDVDSRWLIRPTQPYTNTFSGNRANCIQFTLISAARFEDPEPTHWGFFGSNTNSRSNTNVWLNMKINNSSNNAGFNRNPLGQKYWVFKASSGAEYGVANQKVSVSNPFYGSSSSRGQNFVKDFQVSDHETP